MPNPATGDLCELYFLQLEVCSSVSQDGHIPPREMEGVEEGFRHAYGGADMTIVLQKTQRVSGPDLRQHQTGWCNWSSALNRFMWPMGRYGREGMVEMFLI